MTPDEFRTLAKQIAGPRWRSKLPEMIGKCRMQVYEYAKGSQDVPVTVAKLMELLAVSQEVSDKLHMSERNPR